MPDYNFLNLSPFDFEVLSRDILQKHLGCHIESFASGADKGIDLRCSRKGEVIIQCKRYKNFNSLIENLKKEADKVKVLSPEKYMLVTSVEMNPERKDKIVTLFAPFIQSTGDILGKEDLNNLLTQFPQIESDHFKLWLSSTNVLQNIISRNIINQSRFVLDDIKEKIKLYVKNDSFYEVSSILEKDRYVIISGIPGIGKTTLAEIVVYKLLSEGIEDFIFLSDTIDQGFKMFNPERSQVFLFDDFLGRNFLENSISTNEESLLIKFISKVNNSKNKFLIFTTREYILNQAKQKFDLLDKEDLAKCIIDLSKYTKLIRAKILYNHLFFNNVAGDFVQQITTQGLLHDIIDHRNYNPRIIEAFTKKGTWSNCSKEEFPQRLLDLFDNPEEIWKHALENTISKEARIVLFAYVALSVSIEYDELYHATLIFATSEGNNFGVGFDSLTYKKAIKELEGTFIAIYKYNKKSLIDYQNPSIQDFIINYVNEDEYLKESLIRSSSYLRPLLRIFSYKEGKNDGVRLQLSDKLLDILETRVCAEFDQLKHHTFIYHDRGYSDIDITVVKLSSIVNFLDSVKSKKLEKFVISKLQTILYSDEVRYTASTFLDLLYNYRGEINIDLSKVMKHSLGVVNDYEDLMAFSNLKKIENEVYHQFIGDNYDDFNDMVGSVVDSLVDSLDEDYQETIEVLEEISDEFDIDLSDELEELNGKLAMAESQADFDYAYGKENFGSVKTTELSEDELIDELFESYDGE